LANDCVATAMLGKARKLAEARKQLGVARRLSWLSSPGGVDA